MNPFSARFLAFSVLTVAVAAFAAETSPEHPSADAASSHAEAGDKPTSIPDPEPVPRGHSFVSTPQVRVDLLVISAPERIILPLLPELRRADRVASAQAKLLELAGEGKAKVRGWLDVVTPAGTRARVENVTEYRYGMEWDFFAGSTRKQEGGPSTDPKPAPALQPVPVTFETRNVGASLDVEPVIGVDRETVQLTPLADYVFLVEESESYAGENAKGEVMLLKVQQMATMKSKSMAQVKSGQRCLLLANKPKQHKGDEWIVMILGAEILPEAAE